MKTNLEDISPVKKKLVIEIEPLEVDNKLNETYRDLAKSVKVPGFRPGKVPRKILETRFGNQVIEDVSRNLISETLPKALEEAKTYPISTPLLEKGTLKPGHGFKYTAIMEVRPEFELKNYLGLDAEKENVSVTTKDVQKGLDRLRSSQGKLVSVDEDRPIKKDDYAVIDYEGYEGDKPLDGIKASDFIIKVGANEFHPKFEEALVDLKTGSEKKIEVVFEEDYRHALLAGKRVNFNVKVQGIKQLFLPDLDDDFARSLGADFDDLKGLKKKVEETIIAQEEKRIDTDLKRRLLEKISDSVDFEVPQSMIESQIDYSVENVKQNLLRGGSSYEKAGISEEKLREDFTPNSEKRVKELIILSEIAKLEGITVTEEDMAEGFRQLASRTGQDLENLRKVYQNDAFRDSLRQELLEEKTLNYIVEHANIKKVEKGTLRGENKVKKEGR